MYITAVGLCSLLTCSVYTCLLAGSSCLCVSSPLWFSHHAVATGTKTQEMCLCVTCWRKGDAEAREYNISMFVSTDGVSYFHHWSSARWLNAWWKNPNLKHFEIKKIGIISLSWKTCKMWTYWELCDARAETPGLFVHFWQIDPEEHETKLFSDNQRKPHNPPGEVLHASRQSLEETGVVLETNRSENVNTGNLLVVKALL